MSDLFCIINQPLFKNHWRVIVKNAPKYVQDMVTCESTSLRFTLKPRSLTITLAHVDHESFSPALEWMIANKPTMDVQLLNGEDEVVQVYEFLTCKCIHHECELDYASSEWIGHELRFTFD